MPGSGRRSCEFPADHHPPPTSRKPQPTGGGTPGGRNTSAGSPRPSARARDAHVPEPSPRKHADGEAEGRSPVGQATDGKDSQTPDGLAATARTQATERTAKAARAPTDGDAEARNTRSRAAGTAARVSASMPDAQPVQTRADGGMSGRTERSAATDTPGGRREPETPTQATDVSRAWADDMARQRNKGETGSRPESAAPGGTDAYFQARGGRRPGPRGAAQAEQRAARRPERSAEASTERSVPCRRPESRPILLVLPGAARQKSQPGGLTAAFRPQGGQPFDVAQEPPSAHLRRVRQHRAVPRVDLLPGLTEARGPREGLSVGGRRGEPGGLGLIAAGASAAAVSGGGVGRRLHRSRGPARGPAAMDGAVGLPGGARSGLLFTAVGLALGLTEQARACERARRRRNARRAGGAGAASRGVSR